MTTTVIDVSGTPMPKGSVTKMPNGKYVNQGSVKLTRWMKAVREAATVAHGWEGLMAGPVRITMAFSLAPPVSQIPGARWGWELPAKRPDLDKLERAVLDALTGVVWEDDAQVVALASTKRYSWNYDTGVSVVVTEIDDEAAQQLQGALTRLEAQL